MIAGAVLSPLYRLPDWPALSSGGRGGLLEQAP
jgi:hypothetical protein